MRRSVCLDRDARGMLYAQNLALFGHRSDRLDVTPWVR
jgi:hypothetical protein